MALFESAILLLFARAVLSVVARRFKVPYPALLALAGVALGLLPDLPAVTLDPQVALTLFVAPVLLDLFNDAGALLIYRLAVEVDAAELVPDLGKLDLGQALRCCGAVAVVRVSGRGVTSGEPRGPSPCRTGSSGRVRPRSCGRPC